MKRLILLSAVIASALLLNYTTVQAAAIEYSVNLSGPAESPANASPGIGAGLVTYDPVAHTLQVTFNFSGLTGVTTASHIHAATSTPGTGTAGVATTVPYFPGFPIGVTSGTYDHTLDLTLAGSFNPAYVTAHGGTPAGAEAALAAAMAGGEAYLNVHTQTFPGGEIRGFLTPVPDVSATFSLMVVAMGALGGLRRFSKAI